jgi:hypothetical protein
MWRDIMNQPLKITKWGHFKDSKWSHHKIETFREAQDFFRPLNGRSDREGHFGAIKVEGPSKSQDFVQCIIRENGEGGGGGRGEGLRIPLVYKLKEETIKFNYDVFC